MSTLIIFGILTVLMLTGMPISIALGLTVLTFLFTLHAGTAGIGSAQVIYRDREVRNHGDPLLHFGG